MFARLIGRALPRAQSAQERLPNLQALPILSSDALSSVAYATEASLGVLILAGSSALKQSLPITLAIIALIVIVVLSVIDNLVKGASGQAVQAMNIMFGLDEGAGLAVVPLAP